MILMVPGARLGGDRLRKAFEVDGVCVLASMYAVDDACVDVWLDADLELSEAQCAAAYDRISLFLRLSDTFATPYEAAFWAILTQRLPIPLARKIIDRVTARFGTSIVREGITYRAFPSPGRLRAATENQLRAASIPSAKLRYIRSSIEAFTRIEERWLFEAPAAEVRAWLRAVAGIGASSARLVLVHGLGRMQADDYLRRCERALPAIVKVPIVAIP